MDHSEHSALYLAASAFRANIQKHCMREGRWVYGTLLLVTRGLERQENLLLGGDWCAVLRIQALVEIGAQYVLQEYEDENGTILVRSVHAALVKATAYCGTHVLEKDLLDIVESSLDRCVEAMEDLGSKVMNTGAR